MLLSEDNTWGLSPCANIAWVRDFKIPKHPIRVELLIGGKVRECMVFVVPISASHEGSEDVSDLLKSEDPYLPVEENGSHLCIPKEAIAVAWVETGLHPPGAIGAVRSTEKRVLVTLHSGRQLRGAVRYSRHPDSSRLVDYLNASHEFFTLHQDRVAFVNRRHARSVTLLEQLVEIKRKRKLKAKNGAADPSRGRKASRSTR
jgi:hypothetical protein